VNAHTDDDFVIINNASLFLAVSERRLALKELRADRGYSVSVMCCMEK